MADAARSIQEEDQLSSDSDEDGEGDTKYDSAAAASAPDSLYRYGIFSEPLFCWEKFPCSFFHFADSANMPTAQAKAAMKTLHVDFLGDSFGTKDGTCGASGGGIHLLYLGRSPSPTATDPDAGTSSSSSSPPLSLENVLQLLRLSDHYQSSKMKWMTTLDPMHQHIFPKRMTNEQDDDPSTVPTGKAPPGEVGNVPQSPVFGAFFQLRETHELLALAQWDYRD